MSHVDEGQLHALLDGALEGTAEHTVIRQHLAECADCRARFDDARALHARASSILGDAPSGDIEAPPFTEVLERRRRGAARAPIVRMRRLVGLGWAATIALAAGIGWIARGSLFTGERLREGPAPATAAESVVALDAQAERARSVTSEIEAADVDSPATVGAVVAPMRQEAAPAAAAPTAPEPAVAADEAGAGESVPAAKAGRGVAPQRAEDDRMLVAAAAEVAPAQPDLREEARRTQVQARNLAEAGVIPLETGALWNDSDMERAAAHVGLAIRTISGLETLRVETGTVGAQAAARVTQRLGGDSVILVQYAAAADDADVEGLAAQEAAVGMVTLRRDGLMLVLRGPVSRDSLLGLARRIP